jgi:hypothetical protein
MVNCQGCGSQLSDDLPFATRCGNCPPERCADCGDMDSMESPCKCWISVSDMPLADLKGLFARDGLSIGLIMKGGDQCASA